MAIAVHKPEHTKEFTKEMANARRVERRRRQRLEEREALGTHELPRRGPKCHWRPLTLLRPRHGPRPRLLMLL